MCTSGGEIEFYPNLTPRTSSLALLEAEIPSTLYAKLRYMFFLAPMVAVVGFPLCMDVVEVTVVRMVPFLADPGEARGCSTNNVVID